MTRWAVNRDQEGLKNVRLYNDNAPATAFHYCIGKNKRNADGLVDLTENVNKDGWYMPGIRELERALVQYYILFPEFRGNLYWSASAASDPARYRYSRATRVDIVNGETRYVNSASSGDPGYQLRTAPLRIRAFYKKMNN